MNKKYLLRIYFVIIYTLISASLYAQQNNNGNILLLSDPGYRIYLNDDLKGVTNLETDGLFIQNIEAGNYNLTVKKKGYASKLVHISVISNKTIEIEIEIDRLEKEKSYIRTDGYYVAKTKWTYLEGGLFSRQYRPYIVFVFTNIESGKFNRLVWFPVNTYDRQKKNENSLHDNINECLELGFEEIKNRVNTSGSYKIEKVNDYNNELYFRCSMEELTMKGKVIQREFKNSFSVNIESSSWDNSKRKWIDETYNLDFIFHPYNFE